MDVMLKVRHAFKRGFPGGADPEHQRCRSVPGHGCSLRRGMPLSCQDPSSRQEGSDTKQVREVAWVNQIEMKDFPKGMGVKFLDLSAGDRARLEEYLDELKTQARA